MNIIGVDIGGTKTSIVLAEYHGESKIELLDKVAFSTNVQSGKNYALDHIFKHIDAIIEKYGMKGTDFAIGISCGGPLDAKNGIILSPPNLMGWDNVHITEILRERYGVNTYLQNDANACALAEWMMGAGKGYSNIVYLTFGTGLGAGLILDNRLYNGSNGMAGEVGHIRLERMGPVGYGKAGSFEGFCSGNGIAQMARTMVLEKMQAGKQVSFCRGINEINGITAKTVFSAAKEGDPFALEIVRMCGIYLGQGLSIIVDVLNPEVIILGTIFVHNYELLYPHLTKVVNSESIERSLEICKIVPAQLGESLGDYSSVTTALYGMRCAQLC